MKDQNQTNEQVISPSAGQRHLGKRKWAIIRRLIISLVGLLGLFLALQYLSLYASGTAPTFASTTTTATAQNKVAYTYVISATDPENDALTFAAPTLPSWLTLSATAPVINRTDFVPSGSLNGPTGVARGSDGSIYIADTNNHCIRKVDAAGTVTTFAGTCGAAGPLDTPTALAFDSTGNLYVTESNISNTPSTNRVSKITPDGVTITPLVADANFGYLSGIMLDSANNIYVSSYSNGCVSKIASAGTTYATSATTFVGTCGTLAYADGTGTAATFSNLGGLTTDGTNIYIVDTGNNRIRKIEISSATVTTLAGDGTADVLDGIGTAAKFNDPRGIAYDPAGYLYVTEGASKKIRRITLVTVYVSTFFDGSTGLNTAEQLVRAPNGDLFIADSGSSVIHKVSTTWPTLSGTPNASNEGANSVTIRVSDGGTPVDQTFTINVTNNHPTISGTPSSTTLLIGDSFSFTPTASDPDGDTLTFSITNKPDWATFNSSTGALTGQPTAASSTTGIVISVTDGGTTPISLAAFDLTVLAPSPTPTNTDTPTNTPTNTDTPTNTPTNTDTPTTVIGTTPSPTSILTATVIGATPTFTNTPSPLPTPGEGTPSPLPTSTALRAPTNTSTPSLSPTKTPTPSNTPTPVPSLVADVESVQSGKWNASSTWKSGNIPQKTNVVKINKAHEITLDSSVEIYELQNEGTLRGLNEKLLLIAVSRALYNRGDILSKDGDSSSRNGAALVLQGSFLQNESQIKAGKGLDENISGGNGGSIQIEFGRIENKASAVIQAGGGGSASKGKVGGIGGNISLKGQNTSQTLSGDSLVNEGQIQAGKGGAAIDSGTAVVTTTAIAGDGGSIETNFATLINAAGAKVLAGDGGSMTHDSTMVGNGKGIGGRGGSILSKGGSKTSFALSNLLAEDELPTESFNNTGTFQAGNGGASSYVSGAGGDLSIAAKEVKNATQGTLLAGLGGGIIPGGQNSSGVCGRGGNLRVSGGSQKTTTLTSQTLLNAGLVRAGSGGSIITGTFLTQTSVITGVTGGNGGGIEITAANATNKGQVQAGNGGQGNWGGSGGNSKIGGSTLINEGSIQGGNGGDSDLESGDGGGIELSATLIDNAVTGQLIAGIGGGTKTTALAETGNGDGLSGNVSARSDGSISSKGKITVKSKVSALDILQCQKGLLSKIWCKKILQEKEVEQQKLKIVAIQKHSSSGNLTDTVSLGGKISVAGKFQVMAASGDSQQVAGGIKISGSDTSIEAGSLEVSAGPGMSIGIEDMAPGAIKVDTDVTLAVGAGGSIGLQGMTGVISATKVNLAADKIETGGVDLNTLVGNNVEKLSARVLGHANFSQTPPLHTTPGQAITTTVSLFNDSPALNTFIFTVTKESASWTLTGLPKTQVITGFASANLQLVFSPPNKADVGEETSITVETQAQENPSTQASYSFKVALEVPAAASVVELLQPTPTPTPTATSKPTVTPTPSPFPTLTAPCTCPLKWLIQGNCNSSLSATLAQSQTLDINIFYKVRDLLQKSATGQEYVALYEQNGPEITNLLIADATLRAKTLQTLLLWQPQLQALVAAQSGSVQAVEDLITAELAKSADSLLQDLAAKGSPTLQQAVKNDILAKNPPLQLVGKTITQAQAQVVPPGWKVYLPLVQH